MLASMLMLVSAAHSSGTVSVGFAAALTDHAVLQRGGEGSTVYGFMTRSGSNHDAENIVVSAKFEHVI